ncbi:YjfB family protein [Salipaludibacillus sp. HK11]|uniref:YjfB family protein n=1 Tax=Salipaludibacillus sp. HK11 TaxID=3394320 RepID=UPI0039FD2887
MEIPSLSVAISQAGVNQQGSVSMMQKSLEQAGQQGQALDKLMESAEVQRTEHALQPHLGGSVDVKV